MQKVVTSVSNTLKDIQEDTNADLRKPHVVVLLDESGSMLGNRDAVISTFNEFTNSIIGTAKTLTLKTFDSSGTRTVFNKTTNFRDITTKDYNPRAMTPLYDVIGDTIASFSNSDRPVQLVIHTDGLENASVEYTYENIESLINEKTKEGWLFVYLGEGLSGQAAMKGFAGTKMNFSGSAVSRTAAMSTLGGITETYASHGSNEQSLFCEDGDTIKFSG